jgi:protein-L-isoaspartate(D-aspartate) O-methyltransferase
MTDLSTMLETQIIARGIDNPDILAAMRRYRRALFVPESLQTLAYADQPLALSYGQTISQPYIVAYMLNMLHIAPHHRVLEIGTGSGYVTALLSAMSDMVVSIELIPDLATQAETRLTQMGISNVTIHCTDGYHGWEAQAPYDRIIVSASAPHVPAALLDQLATGGKLVIPVGKQMHPQQIQCHDKDDQGNLTMTQGESVRFVPLVKPKA